MSLVVGLLALLSGLLPSALTAQTLQLNPASGLLRSLPPESAPEPEIVAQGYLYLDPYQARFEALFDAAAMLRLIAPDKEIPTELSAEAQQKLCDELEAKSTDWCRLRVDNETLSGTFVKPSLVRGKPGSTLPFEPGTPLPIGEAMVGFLWEFSTPAIFNEISIEWRGHFQPAKTLPVRIFFGIKNEATEISSTYPRLSWRNQGRLPRPVPLSEVPTVPEPRLFHLPLIGLLWVLVGVLFGLRAHFSHRRLIGGKLPYIVTWLLGIFLAWPLLQIPIPLTGPTVAVATPADAEAILTPLLRNAYRAFDQRSESAIYDVLARSVDGELLRRLYLETLQALTLEGREGTRVTITEFDATVNSVQPSPSGFITECQWTALGTVGHWGHAHTRVNRYTAAVTITPLKGEWKMTALEVHEARRL